ncbi:ABC transporter permease [Phyllobacterium sp. YR531]|uniref:ABC transporter permease n=1 Tax=Phyllobacterium sp. YR531 TaxID=1144343 RepID=UPI00026F869A|nr:ABC transporter permease [Phyllobacterium sp. YR531]EJN06342.1 ABC-type polysaccharide/polyol phosphate export system, permease component [Phyllobacterium sp. YR531]
MHKEHSYGAIARDDILRSIRNFQLAALLGWQDVVQRYRRSSIGAFWLTINMGVLIAALGFVFGTIFDSKMSEFLPFICIGLIFWGYFNQLINEGSTSFITNSETLLQLPIPFFTFVLRTWWRNTIILLHNLVIYPVVLIFFGALVDTDVLLVVPGFILLSINLLWMMLILAILCTRYRDLAQIIQNIMQVGMYVTPVMWMPSHLPTGTSPLMLNINPFFHLLSIIREPLQGRSPIPINWYVPALMAILGWTVALFLFGKYRQRINYWL